MALQSWNRLADATGQSARVERPQLSIVTLGHVHESGLTALVPHFSHLEQLVLDIPPRDALSNHRAEFNRAVDAASHDWLLLVREREAIDEELAVEVAAAIVDGKSRGFRLRSIPYYAGAPLRIGVDEGDVRLFHRRYYLRHADKGKWDRLMIQGTVVRLDATFRSVTFESSAAHREYLKQNAARRSALRRLLRFASYALSARTVDRNTLRYLWVEASFDSGGKDAKE